MIAKIAVSAATFAIDKPYSYTIPEELPLECGVRVTVPFGPGNRRTEGIVLGIEEGFDQGLKTVERRLDDSPLLSMTMLRLAAFMRERYFCTFYDAIRAILPAGLWFQSTDTYTICPDCGWESASIRQKDAKVLLQHMQDLGGQGTEAALHTVVPDEEAFSKAISYLIRKKYVTCQSNYRRRTMDKTEKIATLAVSAEEAKAYAGKLGKGASMQRAVLELLSTLGSVAVKELCYFTGAGTATVNRLEKLGFITLSHRELLRCSQIKPAHLDGPLLLNAEQKAAFDGISCQMDQDMPGTALLYGITGSGKTSVYLKLIQRCLDRGKSAILLVPEIALTPQLLSLLSAYFGKQVAVLHSSLSAGERYDQWKRVRSSDARVIVGTRSAVFAPCVSPGLIILDEEQEHSYKSENSPRYSAREIAMWRGYKEKALVLLGSATPSVETMYHAKNGEYRLYKLNHRYNGRELPAVKIVDMRQELQEGNDRVFSDLLCQEIEATAYSGKQAILFLNRRGNSRALVCVDCRQAPECPRCSARLTYHSANDRLMCHYCGYSQRSVNSCPQCGSRLKQVGVGTQKAQRELLGRYPRLEVERMDTDTVTAVNTHEVILDRFKNRNIPVLIGTQMVAKGLNLPNVTLVGVLDADLGLYSDSFRAAENTFNMLTQVVGRAGRGDFPGKALIQTMVPEHKVIGLAAKQDYDGFYDLEIGLRRLQNCPPFADLTVVTFSGQEEGAVIRGAARFRDSLLGCLGLPEYRQKTCTVLGPAPSPVPKINYNFRYRLILRCQMDHGLRLLMAHLLRQFLKDRENRGVSAYVDVNGFD